MGRSRGTLTQKGRSGLASHALYATAPASYSTHCLFSVSRGCGEGSGGATAAVRAVRAAAAPGQDSPDRVWAGRADEVGSGRGKFTIHVRTMRKRLRRSLKRVSAWCQRHRHEPVVEQWAALNAMLRGHYQYYGRATNFRRLWEFYRTVRRLWRKWLNRRTRGRTLPWRRYEALLVVYPLQRPYIARPWVGAGSHV